MKIVVQPERKDWKALLQRPYVDNGAVLQKVKAILDAVKGEGDDAVKRFSKQFDQFELESLVVPEAEIENAIALVPDTLKSAIQHAKRNIEIFHAAQLTKPAVVSMADGIACWQKSVAIDKVGLYIPGGTAPLFSTVLMLAVPAQLAGCKQIILCTPAGKDG